VNDDILNKPFPKAVEIVSLSLACAMVGGIWLGSHASPKAEHSLTLPTVLLIAGGVLLLVGIAMVARVKGFAWNTWMRVGKWALLAYIVESGMILYAFVHNQVRGSTLAVVIGLIALFAIDVPFLIATTVARYDD
jgi:hypothetical protein